jgi:hypothetical protein
MIFDAMSTPWLNSNSAGAKMPRLGLETSSASDIPDLSALLAGN